MSILARAIDRQLTNWYKTGDTLQPKTIVELVGTPGSYVDTAAPTNAELLADVLALAPDGAGWGTCVTLAGKTWRVNEVGPPTLIFDTTAATGSVIELYTLLAGDLAANTATIATAVTVPADCALSYLGGSDLAHGVDGVLFTAGAAGAATVSWPAPTAVGSGAIADEMVAGEVLTLYLK